MTTNGRLTTVEARALVLNEWSHPMAGKPARPQAATAALPRRPTARPAHAVECDIDAATLERVRAALRRL